MAVEFDGQGQPERDDVDSAVSAEDRRTYPRYGFCGSEFAGRVEKDRFLIRLRDLSCRGASCFSENPLRQGDLIYVELARSLCVAAEVRWVRHLVVGLQFLNPLPLDAVRQIHRLRGGAAMSSMNARKIARIRPAPVAPGPRRPAQP